MAGCGAGLLSRAEVPCPDGRRVTRKDTPPTTAPPQPSNPHAPPPTPRPRQSQHLPPQVYRLERADSSSRRLVDAPPQKRLQACACRFFVTAASREGRRTSTRGAERPLRHLLSSLSPSREGRRTSRPRSGGRWPGSAPAWSARWRRAKRPGGGEAESRGGQVTQPRPDCHPSFALTQPLP
jgi:hypothetical protein